MGPQISRVFVFAVLFVILLSSPLVGRGSGYRETRKSTSDCLEITLLERKISKNKIDLSIQIENVGNEMVLLAQYPTTVTGSKSPYVEIDRERRTLELSSRLFPAPLAPSTSDLTGVTLTPLLASERRILRFSISFPLRETEPPHKYSETNKLIKSAKDVEFLSLVFGYFHYDEDVRSVLRTRLFGWVVAGHEVIKSGPRKGETLLDLQKLIELGPVSMDNPN